MRRTRLAGAGTLVVALLAIGGLGSGHGVLGLIARTLGADQHASASAATGAALPTAGDSFEPALGLPATNVVVIGASPLEGKEEAWAYGTIGDVPAIVNGRSYADQKVLLEHAEGSGWQVVALPAGRKGEPLAPNSSAATFPEALGPLAGRATAAGGVVLITDGGLVSRDPGAQPGLVSPPSSEAKAGESKGGEPKTTALNVGTPSEAEPLLSERESVPPAVPPSGASTPYAAIEDAGHTGILIAPYQDGAGSAKFTRAPGVLHYDGAKWSREPIGSASTAKPVLAPQAIACGGTTATAPAGSSSPANCWLLAAYKSEAAASATNRVALFRRVPVAKTVGNSSGYKWEEASVPADPQPLLGEPTPASSEPLSVTTLGKGAQTLTVTSQGVWVDFQAKPGGGQAVDVSKLVTASQSAKAEVAGTWCYPLGTICTSAHAQSLGAPLEVPYQSFAWSGSGAESGTRIITGLPDGALLELAGGSFSYAIGAGGRVGGAQGAAFGSPAQGWIGAPGIVTADKQGQAQVIDVTPRPQGDQLQESPVPFRYPLLAVAQAPGSTPGDPGARAIATGIAGEIGRYTPGQGWRPESLYNAAGNADTHTLRGVAWPGASRAYAVGDNGTMWLWRADTGLWESDPAKPLNFIGDLTAIAFSPSNPDLGYAVGKDGALLRFGKSWTQVALPAELQHVNFTSVTFAGGEVLASYRTVVPSGGPTSTVESGGVAVQEGTGPWHVDPSAAALLAQLPQSGDAVLSKVAGLADGGAVAAGPGLVIERDSDLGAWRFSSQPLPEAQNVSALGAYREASGAVRAVVSVDLDSVLNPNIGDGDPLNGPWSSDRPPPTGAGQPPGFPTADPLPNTGYLLRETASGWSDMEHMALEAPNSVDMPVRPDPVLALLVDPRGRSGLAVGGQTYDLGGADNGSKLDSPGSESEFQTAAAIRFGTAGTSVGGDVSSPIATTTGDATFAIGGEAACEASCSDFSGEGLAPDVGLAHALQVANQIFSASPGGLRGFLYTGQRLRASPSCTAAEAACVEPFERELRRYQSLLGGGGGSLPVYSAASGDLAPGAVGIGPLAQALIPAGAVSGPPGTAAYALTSSATSGGPVAVIVLDYSTGVLGAAQEAWLSRQLSEAAANRAPAIVVGNASLDFRLPEQTGDNPGPLLATDAAAVSAILTQTGASASAYLFDYPGNDVHTVVSAGGRSIPAYGSGTLGYTSPAGRLVTDSLGSSGFLLLDINTNAVARQASNVAPISVRAEPNISQLALNATDGVFLRRSHVALFEALARRPPGGLAIAPRASGVPQLVGHAPYDPIPFNCQGPNCADTVPQDYTFSSSNPDIGDFVARDPSYGEPRSHNVELGPNQLPVADPRSGLFCAFNAGTTTVSITTGGLSYSEPVTIQAGSVEYPCGTVPLKNPPLREAPEQASFSVPEPPLAGAPPPVNPQIQSVVPPPPPLPPVVPAPVHPKVHVARPVAALLFVPLVQPLVGARPAIVPPPAPPVARPIPPSGTSQVSQTVGAVEKEREDRSATEVAVSSKFAAYDVNQRGGPGPWIPMLLVLATGAGVGIGRGRRSSPRGQPALALAAARRRRPRR